jgi:hypothetical protein
MAMKIHRADSQPFVKGPKDCAGVTLDIKPYLSDSDAFPDARCGWVKETGIVGMKQPINTVS